VGHSRVVAELAAQAGARLGLDGPQVGALRRAGHVLDLGRIGVPNRVWGKTSALSTAEKERVRLHPYLIQRILARVDAVHGIAQLAGAHHERLDGSGYPQGTSGAELRLPERVLAAADTYQSLREPHPHQPAHGPDGCDGSPPRGGPGRTSRRTSGRGHPRRCWAHPAGSRLVASWADGPRGRRPAAHRARLFSHRGGHRAAHRPQDGPQPRSAPNIELSRRWPA